jgi:hypothetical protein
MTRVWCRGSGYAVVVFCQSRKAAAGLELKVYHHRGGVREIKEKAYAYLLFGPGQLTFELPLLVEQSLVFSAQRREPLRKLLSELRDILVPLVYHACVSEEQRWLCDYVTVSLWGETSSDCAAKRLRVRQKKKNRRMRRQGWRSEAPRAAPKRQRPVR